MGSWLSKRESPGFAYKAKEPLKMDKVSPTELDELGFILTELKPGSERAFPCKGDECCFGFHCWLPDGTVVASSSMVRSKVGVGRLIRGFDRALLRMNVGQKCKLLCSPNHGYGFYSIPGTQIGLETVLIFELDLIDVCKDDSTILKTDAVRDNFVKDPRVLAEDSVRVAPSKAPSYKRSMVSFVNEKVFDTHSSTNLTASPRPILTTTPSPRASSAASGPSAASSIEPYPTPAIIVPELPPALFEGSVGTLLPQVMDLEAETVPPPDD